MSRHSPAVAERFLIISLHDVAASTFPMVRAQFDQLGAMGASRVSILAIPRYHGQERLEDDGRLCEWLRVCESQGHEVVLHGWTHQSPELRIQNSGGRTVQQWFYEEMYTTGEAEFFGIGYGEAHERIGSGVRLFQSLGLRPRGFIAPAWLMNGAVEKAAKDQGLMYTNTISELIHLPSGKRRAARSCVWSTRAAWRRGCSRLWNAALFRRLENCELLRISLHPDDLEHPAIWRQITRFIGLALRNRRALTYGDWVRTNFSGTRISEFQTAGSLA